MKSDEVGEWLVIVTHVHGEGLSHSHGSPSISLRWKLISRHAHCAKISELSEFLEVKAAVMYRARSGIQRISAHKIPLEHTAFLQLFSISPKHSLEI